MVWWHLLACRHLHLHLQEACCQHILARLFSLNYRTSQGGVGGGCAIFLGVATFRAPSLGPREEAKERNSKLGDSISAQSNITFH